MSSESRFQAARRHASALLVTLVLACLAACNGSDSVMSPAGPFKLTFSLDASFQAPHGDQPINWALLRSSDGFKVAAGNGTVSATQDPSLSFGTGAVLEKEIAYEVHYWIDSNIGGGTLGVCDPKAIDHQWSTEFPSPTNDIDFTVSHNATLTEDVCGTFNP